MKWGRKKAFSNSSSSPSLINHVFSASWLKRLKLKSGSAEPGETKVKQKGKLDVKSVTSSRSANWNEGRFYSGVDDLYWRLSFGDEGFEEETSTGGVRSLWYDSDDEVEVPMSSCNSSRSRSRSRSEDSQRFRFKDMVSKMRVMEYNVGIMQEKDDLKGTQARETKFKARKEKVVKKAGIKRGSFKAKEVQSLQSAERIIQMKDDFQKPRAINSRRQRSLSCPSYNLRTIGEDCTSESEELQDVNAFSEDEFSSDWKKFNNMRTKKIRPKNEHRRKSVFVRRGNLVKGRKANARIKACSSRTAAKNECKIKALEDMKKAKKTRKKMEGETAFDGYAVIKSSFDPQQDFRDSMLEMIIQKEIKHPEELEELLVCYLTLNCSQYHDLIIKVFRQVWFEVNRYMFKCR